MATTAFKTQLNSMLGDEMKRLEMDVTNSFLNGKICSPLMATATNALQGANAIEGTALNAAAAAGLYITKDGLQYDPNAAASIVQSILNVAINTTKAELLNIRNRAWNELTYIPDPSIILEKATSYFTYYITNEFDADSILDFTSADDKIEKLKDEQPNKTMEIIEEYVNTHLPKINDAITTAAEKITEYCTYATYYASFGPEWLTDKISYGIDTATSAINKDVSNITNAVNDFKLDMYDKAGEHMGQQMIKLYENLIRQQAQELNAEIDVKKKQALLKARSLLYKANLKIYEATGVNLPLDMLSSENLSKIKTAQKLAKLANIASAGSSQETSTVPVGKPADETAQNTSYEETDEKYSTDYINAILAQIKTISTKLARRNNELINIGADEQNISLANKNMVNAQTIEMGLINYLEHGENIFNYDKTYHNIDDLILAATLLINAYFEENSADYGLTKDADKLPVMNPPTPITV